jgi:HEAT repeat protein
VIGDNAVPELTPILNNGNRDMRSEAARALSLAGSTSAIPALRERLNIETVPQVQLALSDAIRELTSD